MENEEDDHIKITELSSEDKEGILNLLRQLVKEIYGDEKVGLENYEKFYKTITFYKKIDSIRNKNIKIIVAKENNRIIGFACIMIKNKIVYLEDIVVDKNYRGRGIGSRLIDYILRNFSRKIKLETHEKAVKFFERMGFKVYRKRNEKDGILWFYMKNF